MTPPQTKPIAERLRANGVYWDEKLCLEGADTIDALLEALEAAMAFIDSHVADPDITEEMALNWIALQELDPHAAIKRARATQ